MLLIDYSSGFMHGRFTIPFSIFFAFALALALALALDSVSAMYVFPFACYTALACLLALLEGKKG